MGASYAEAAILAAGAAGDFRTAPGTETGTGASRLVNRQDDPADVIDADRKRLDSAISE